MNLRKFKKFIDGAKDTYHSYEQQQSRDAGDGESAAPAPATAPQLDDGSNIPLSECNGNKKSLFIGINYFGSKSELRGCINDVNNIKQFVVTNFNFPTDAEHMKTLVDDDQNNMPTRDNIIAGFRWLIQDGKEGDSLFLHYSGHGGSQKDNGDADDADGQDETLVPVDYEKNGVIVDDDIYEELVAKLPKGVRLTCIMDCCHSGSILDLPYTYGIDGNDDVIEVDNRKAVMDAAMKAGMALLQGNKEEALAAGLQALQLHFMAPSNDGPSKQSLAPSDKQIQLRSAVADVIQFSGCRDSQTSADAQIDGKATGALSWSVIKAFEEHGLNQTYVDLLKNIRTILNGKYTQVPQMSTGRKMDMNTTFKM